MVDRKPKPAAAHNTPADSSAAVDQFMATLKHPCKTEIRALRKLILAVDPSIADGIKWRSKRKALRCRLCFVNGLPMSERCRVVCRRRVMLRRVAPTRRPASRFTSRACGSAASCDL